MVQQLAAKFPRRTWPPEARVAPYSTGESQSGMSMVSGSVCSRRVSIRAVRSRNSATSRSMDESLPPIESNLSSTESNLLSIESNLLSTESNLLSTESNLLSTETNLLSTAVNLASTRSNPLFMSARMLLVCAIMRAASAMQAVAPDPMMDNSSHLRISVFAQDCERMIVASMGRVLTPQICAICG